MKHLFDDVVTHHDYGRNEDRAEDKFVDKLKHLTETTWGLKKKKSIEKVTGVKRTTKKSKLSYLKMLDRQYGVANSRSKPFLALSVNKQQRQSLHPLSPASNTGEKRANLATMHRISNETLSITAEAANTIKKQTIDNSLVSTTSNVDQEEPTTLLGAARDGSTVNNINQELGNILSSSEGSSIQQSTDSRDSIHDNSLLVDYHKQQRNFNFH